MTRFSTNAKDDKKPAAGNDNNGAAGKQSAHILADALKSAMRDAFLTDGKGPSAFEALAMALAGDKLEFPIGEQLARIADAFERIADVMEEEADE